MTKEHKTRQTKRVREIQRQIRDVLVRDFDPIPGAPRDEYDGLIPDVYRLLERRPTLDEVTQWLHEVEHGFGGARGLDGLRHIAARLQQINVDPP